MFLVNNEGRITDVPARMEADAYLQAREVLSISSELMQGIPSGVLMNDYDAQKLKTQILAKFPNVITDEAYLELHPRVPVIDSKAVEIKKGVEIVSSIMTKKEILAVASENGIELSKQEEGLTKDKLIALINDRS